MCTLIIAHGVFEQAPLFAIDNRDEALDRPARPPQIHRRGAMPVLAPQDLEAGGTWVGLNAQGLFGAVTNRFRQGSQDHHRSRGELVFRALEKGDAQSAAATIETLAPADYAGFHLALADAQDLILLWNDGQYIHRLEPGAGIHVITERSFGAAPSKRLTDLEAKIAGLGDDEPALRHRLMAWMAHHDEAEPLESTCVHLGERNYGTRSSTLVQVGASWRFEHLEGSPCEQTFDSYDEPLQRLRTMASRD